MTRITRQGTANQLYPFTAADIPVDNDLSHSFFRYVDFSRRTGGNPAQRFDGDLSAVNLFDCDFIDCKAQNVTLGTGKTRYLMSRRTDWQGATLPADVSSYSHDLMAEVYRQASNAAHPIITETRRLVLDHYANSWSNMVWELINTSGFTPQDVYDQGMIAFTGYPHLQTRLTRQFDSFFRGEAGQWGAERWLLEHTVIWYTDKFIEVPERDVKVQVVGAGNDRWALARMIEQFTGHPAIYVAMVDPSIVIVQPVSPDSWRNDPDWWTDIWKVG